MKDVEIIEPTIGNTNLTEAELFALIQSSSIVQEKMKEGHRIIAGLMEKYPDFEDRLSGKVPHP